MTKKEKVKKILEELHKKFGEPKCALNFETTLLNNLPIWK